jgi:hypothetical protein
MKTMSFRMRARAMCAATAAVGLILAGETAWAVEPSVRLSSGFIAMRQQACGDLQRQYDAYAAANPNDPALKSFQERLVCTDQTAALVMQDLSLFWATFAQKSTAIIGGSPQAAPKKAPMGSLKLLEAQRTAWSRLAPIRSDDAKTQELLEKYFQAYCRGTNQGIVAYSQPISTSTPDEANEVARLTLVFSWLAYPDDAWTSEISAALGTRVKKTDVNQMLEDLALRGNRPKMAYSLANLLKPANANKPDSNDYSIYLAAASDQMLRSQNVDMAMTYLRQAMELAKSDEERTNQLTFRLAEVLADTDNTKEALALLDQILERSSSAGIFGRAAVMRLKNLYSLSEFQKMESDAKKYQQDPRCADYLAQILYMGWVASKQVDKAANEAVWRQAFMEKFPDNVLGADLVFSAAMQALAASRYDEAHRLLAYIEYRYPKSKIVPKVREISKRLESSAFQTSGPK